MVGWRNPVEMITLSVPLRHGLVLYATRGEIALPRYPRSPRRPRFSVPKLARQMCCRYSAPVGTGANFVSSVLTTEPSAAATPGVITLPLMNACAPMVVTCEPSAFQSHEKVGSRYG